MNIGWNSHTKYIHQLLFSNRNFAKVQIRFLLLLPLVCFVVVCSCSQKCVFKTDVMINIMSSATTLASHSVNCIYLSKWKWNYSTKCVFAPMVRNSFKFNFLSISVRFVHANVLSPVWDVAVFPNTFFFVLFFSRFGLSSLRFANIRMHIWVQFHFFFVARLFAPSENEFPDYNCWNVYDYNTIISIVKIIRKIKVKRAIVNRQIPNIPVWR